MASYQYEPNLRYAKTHEWAQRDGPVVVVGISDPAQDLMSDIVFVELPELGEVVSAGDAIAVVESVKAAEDVITPVAGTIVEINEELLETPELVNDDPYGAWFFKVECGPTGDEALAELMDAEEYKAFVDAEEG